MSKKIIIFITTFIITGIIIVGVYLWINKDKATNTKGETPWYQSFNPFGSGSIVENPNIEPDPNNPIIDPSNPEAGTSRFYQITDFGVAGATFLEDIRPIEINPNEEAIQQPKEIKTVVDAKTKAGRMEIQKILNTELSLTKPLVVDGVFGKLATAAIKQFQTKNNLTVTGLIDAETAPYFTITTTSISEKATTEIAPSIRYVEKKNGHVYKMFLDTKSKEKISNSTIPGIHEAFFSKDANSVIYRYLSTDKVISTFMATLGAPKGEFLPQNITNLSLSPDKDKFFYLTKNQDGSTGTIGVFNETRRENVFVSPFTEWLPEWTNNKGIYLTTKPSYAVNGSIFLLNTSNKTLTKILGGISGITTSVNKSGSLVLYGASTAKGPELGVFDINKNETKNLNLFGLPEKCVWSIDNINIYCALPNLITGNQYPDVWYQGLVSFDDYFVKINTQTGDKTTIANSANETPIDGTALFLDNGENNLFFINKKDYTLWGLKIITN